MLDVTCGNKTVQEQLNCGLFSLIYLGMKDNLTCSKFHLPAMSQSKLMLLCIRS